MFFLFPFWHLFKIHFQREKKTAMGIKRNKKAGNFWQRKEGRKACIQSQRWRKSSLPRIFFITVAKHHLWHSDMIWQIYADQCEAKNPFKVFYRHFLGSSFRHLMLFITSYFLLNYFFIFCSFFITHNSQVLHVYVWQNTMSLELYALWHELTH